MQYHARRRSCLTVPGGTEKMLRKAAGLPADEIILDLEDAVAPDAKVSARQLVVDALRSGLFAGRQVAVRVNALGTPWHGDDLAALSAIDDDRLSLVLPKIESAAEIAAIESRLGPARAIGLQVLVETAAGLLNCASIAAASRHLRSLIVGYADLASSLGRTGEASWLFAQETVLMSARANGLQAIDGPCFDLSPESGRLGRESSVTAAMGFDGKWAIHPAQIEPINAAYTPPDAAIARARGILAALDRAQARGDGAASHDGAMIDEAMRLGALRVLSRTEGDQ
ncbi:MAG: CoA ester lyase [Devosia nanyangense]|uniref:CoA ester lyase n=1 Tax=Devosia nanyangense TaxID=1228055 RepID=A0A933L305_9HYPH|nr:CoA ester lyase [Devosia nanyangense]